MSHTLIVLPDDTAKPILDPINAAEHDLQIRMFLFTEPTLLHAVIAAKRRGVKVRVMLNPARRSGETENKEARKALVAAGLHPATGGNGLSACSGDMLLEALVACAGVTLNAVATAIGIVVQSGAVRAEGDLDFRGTLGVAKDAPVGFQRIRLYFDLNTDASEDELSTLIRLTERYCVVYQTLRQQPAMTVSRHVSRPENASGG